MEFGNPQALWFFLIVPFFLFLHNRSFSDMGRFQRGLSIFLRLALITALILALADTRLVQRSDKLAVFFLYDGSSSVGEAANAMMDTYITEAFTTTDEETDEGGVIAFGRDAYMEAGMGSNLGEFMRVESEVGTEFTDLAGAINLALASLPADRGARIVLMSDGNENLGDALTSARIAANRGVQIDCIPFGEPTEGEVVAGRLIMPRRVEKNEMFDVRAVIESQSETTASIEVYENDMLIGTRDIDLVPGKNVFTFPRQQEEGGFYSYKLHVIAEGDIEGSNNIATDYTIVEGNPKVLFVSGDPTERPFLVNALRDEDIIAEFRDLSGLPTSLIQMAPYDVIMFSDVGAELLMPETMRLYENWVSDLGGGFAMIGGENSYGPGGYYRTPIEEMLPVNMDLTRKELMPDIGIAIAIDKSGSMGMMMGQATKIEIAKEGCRLVVDLLDETDSIGIVGFDYAGQWAVPFQRLRDKDEIIDMIGTMRAGGGTSVYAGMESCYNALIQSDTKIRHMIILSDGITAWADFEGLVNKMNDYDITLTTVAVGADSNQQLMSDLANLGGGNYYYTPDINSVPQIFTKEAFLMTNRALVEEPTYAARNMMSPTTEGINFPASPVLLGYISTELKPKAIEALTSRERAEPLLAHWQYGLGRSLAFTSDAKAKWAAAWLNWVGYQQMWTQSVRWLVGGQMAGNLVPNVYFRAGKAHISVDAIDHRGEIITDAIVKANVADPVGNMTELTLFQVAPGRYESSVDATEIGSYLVNISQVDSDENVIDQVSSGFSVSYPPEYENSGPDLFLLQQLADISNGTLGGTPSEAFRHTNQPVARYFDLWLHLLMAAMILLPFDIAVRRLSFTGESVEFFRERASQAMIGFLTNYRAEREKPTHIAALKQVKEQYKLSAKSDESLASSEDVDRRIREILAKKIRGDEDSYAGDPSKKKGRGRGRKDKKPPTSGSLKKLLKAKKRIKDDDYKD